MLEPDEGPRDEVPRAIGHSDLKQRTRMSMSISPSCAFLSDAESAVFAGGDSGEEEGKVHENE